MSEQPDRVPTVHPAPAPASGAVRRALGPASRIGAALAVLAVASVALAGSASAEPALGWPSTPTVEPLYVVLVLVLIPIGLFVLLTAMVYLPPAVRGEELLPRHTPVAPEGEWIGGPRRAAGELAAPDTEESKAGGAGGTW